jgi:hypothetical protein
MFFLSRYRENPTLRFKEILKMPKMPGNWFLFRLRLIIKFRFGRDLAMLNPD